MAKREELTKYLDYPDLRLRFFAERTYKDANGNEITTHYAKASALQNLVASLEAEAARITAQQGVAQEQGQSISDMSELISQTVNKAHIIDVNNKAIENSQAQSDERLAQIRQTVTLLNEAIAGLQSQASQITSYDKGVYLSEAALHSKCAEPTEGDCASVAKPYYLTGSIFDPSTFFGETYLGEKAEHPEWANNTESVNHLYYTSNDTLYEIVKPTTLQFIADAEHNPDSELIEEGIIIEVIPIETSIGEQVPFYLYIVENGKWVNSHIVREFTATNVTQSLNVLDGEQNQQAINDVNKSNALMYNYNVADIQDAINTLIHNFFALCEKVCVTSEVDLQPMPHLLLSRMIADGDGSNNRLDVCQLPIILS